MGTKAAIFDIDGDLIAEAYEESKLYYPRPGWVEQNSDEIYASAVLGSAILAGYAVGVFNDLAATAQRFVEVTDRIEPNLEKHRVYQPLVREYASLFSVTKPVFDALAAAPGRQEVR